MQDHLEGKQYKGWLAIREKLAEMQKAAQEKGGGSRRPKEPDSRERDRERDRDRRRSSRSDRERERDPSRRDRDRDRDRDRCCTELHYTLSPTPKPHTH